MHTRKHCSENLSVGGFYFYLLSIYLFIYLFLGLYLQHMEVLRLGV